MLFRLAADVVLVLHFAFIVFVVAGALLALRWRWIPWLQLPAAAWGFFIEVSGDYCPLTGIENVLLHRAGLAGYHDGFIAHYLLAVIYPAGLTRHVQFLLAAIVVVLNLAIYGWLLLRRLRARRGRNA